MADFCKQCSEEVLGEDFGDLAELVKEGQVLHTICEGCGDCIVDHTGKCVARNCLKNHGVEQC